MMAKGPRQEEETQVKRICGLVRRLRRIARLVLLIGNQDDVGVHLRSGPPAPDHWPITFWRSTSSLRSAL